MQILFNFKKMESSLALQSVADQKIRERIERFSTKPIVTILTFSTSRHRHKVQCSVKGGDGFNFQVEAVSNDMYASLDLLAEKLEAQLRRRKERLKNHRNENVTRRLKLVKPQDEFDCDSIPVDAEDLLKYERARIKVSNG